MDIGLSELMTLLSLALLPLLLVAGFYLVGCVSTKTAPEDSEVS